MLVNDPLTSGWAYSDPDDDACEYTHANGGLTVSAFDRRAYLLERAGSFSFPSRVRIEVTAQSISDFRTFWSFGLIFGSNAETREAYEL